MLTDDHTTVMLDITQALLLFGDISASLLASLQFFNYASSVHTFQTRPDVCDVTIITFLCISIPNIFSKSCVFY